MKNTLEGMAIFSAIAAFITLVLGPYITHIVWCIQKADETGSAIALLIIGVVAAPVGWVHGLSIWFGYGWL